MTEAHDFVLPAAAVARAGGWPNLANENISTTITQGVNRRKETTPRGKLTVTASPNPSWNYFTLTTQSGSRETLQLKVLDVLGRIVETRNGVAASTTFHIGNKFRSGVYLVEVKQGTERQILKLIRQ